MLHTLWQRYRRIFSGRIPELPPLQAYQLWAESYDDIEGNALLFAEHRAILPLIESHDLNRKSILDAGCGTGRNIDVLRAAHPRVLFAADLAPNMLERAYRKYHGSKNIFFQQALVEQLPFRDEQFDFILCTLVLGHVANLKSAVDELSRVLRHGGTLVTSCFHPVSDLAGWQRTFTARTGAGKDRLLAVIDYHHSHAEYRESFKDSGLEIVHMSEPVIDDSLRPFYERARRMDLFYRYRGFPLLLVFEVHKA